MNVLFLSPRDGWPLESGARLRDFHLAKALASVNNLTYVYFASRTAPADMQAHLGGSTRALSVPHPETYTLVKLLKGLLGPRPLPVENYTSPLLQSTLRTLLTSRKFDVVHLDSIHLSSYLPLIRELAAASIVVLNWHNIESELMRRFAGTAALPKRTYALLTAAKLRTLENRLLIACDGHLTCSERERVSLLRREPAARVAVIENGVDTDRFTPAAPVKMPDTLLFVGQLSYHANAEAITSFARSIWPEIKRRHPHLRLAIVGSDPSAEVLALRSHPGVEVHANVPDVLPYYQAAFASVVPLQTGGGTRLKILEAMAAGAPVISTVLGAEGLDVEDGTNISIVENHPAHWLRAIEALAEHDRRATRIANARRLVCARYDWKAIGSNLVDLYSRWTRLTQPT